MDSLVVSAELKPSSPALPRSNAKRIRRMTPCHGINPATKKPVGSRHLWDIGNGVRAKNCIWCGRAWKDIQPKVVKPHCVDAVDLCFTLEQWAQVLVLLRRIVYGAGHGNAILAKVNRYQLKLLWETALEEAERVAGWRLDVKCNLARRVAEALPVMFARIIRGDHSGGSFGGMRHERG